MQTPYSETAPSRTTPLDEEPSTTRASSSGSGFVSPSATIRVPEHAYHHSHHHQMSRSSSSTTAAVTPDSVTTSKLNNADVAQTKSEDASGASPETTTATAQETQEGEAALPRTASNKPNFNKGRAFWMIMLSLAMSMFLSALDLTALSTALPRIATDLESENFTWIGSAYALASTAFCECLDSSFFARYIASRT